MAKEQDAEAREKQIKSNSREATDAAKKQLGIPQKKSRENTKQAAFKTVRKATKD